MAKHTASLEVPVLIVGGSLVGLSTALFLAKHGIESLTVERHPGTAIHPRAGHLHLRTLELMRSVGLEESLRRISAERYFPNGGINAMRTLAGGEIASFIPNLNGGVEEFSPSRRLFVAQDAIEPLLRARAEELGATLRNGAEVVHLYPDAEGVTVVVRDRATGDEEAIRARYVVAADGSRSAIRSQLGIGMQGHGLLSRSATVYFRADCRELLEGTELGVIYIDNPTMRGLFRFERSGTAGFLMVSTLGDPTRPENLDVTTGLTNARAAELVRVAVGIPDLDVHVEDVAHWNATAEVADHYQQGRIFLAGDAAHVVPPHGGFGGNTGIQDAHNLAWKLAMVIRGVAGDGLLASYEAERWPVGRLTIDQAYSRYRRRVTPELMTDDVPALVDDFSMEIGYRYHSSAVIPDSDVVDTEEIVGHPRDATGRPGTRAPHVEYTPGVSTLDLFGSGFVLLSGRTAQPWRDAARSVADGLGIPLEIPPVGPNQGAVAEAYGITDDGAVLVRPDGFVGWRSHGASLRSHDEITGAVQALLSQRVVAAPVNAVAMT